MTTNAIQLVVLSQLMCLSPRKTLPTRNKTLNNENRAMAGLQLPANFRFFCFFRGVSPSSYGVTSIGDRQHAERNDFAPRNKSNTPSNVDELMFCSSQDRLQCGLGLNDPLLPRVVASSPTTDARNLPCRSSNTPCRTPLQELQEMTHGI